MDTPQWVADAIFYQIFPDRFARSGRISESGLNLEPWDSPPTSRGFKGGDLFGITLHLDYLEDLGINAVYLTPVFKSASNHRYHTYDYYCVDPLLGGNEALRELIDQAHRRQIRVILDGVFNHVGRGFWQFHHTLENNAYSPYVDWFHFNPDHLAGRMTWDAYPSPGVRQALERDGSLKTIGYQTWWDTPDLPKFNTRSLAVREFIFGVAEHWTQFGIDGWRLDVPGEIDDDSFWREFRTRVRACNSEAYLVGEIWHDARRWLQGDQFDAAMNYMVAATSLSFFPGKHLNQEETLKVGGYRGIVQPIDGNDFAKRIESYLGLYPPAVNQAQFNLLDSHDTPRFITSAGGDLDSLKLALTFLFTYPGAPCIFYGDEIGLAGTADPDCRKSFPWDEGVWNNELRGFTKHLIAMRKLHPALRQGRYMQLHADLNLYAFERSLDGNTLVTVLNTAEVTRRIELYPNRPASPNFQLLSGSAKVLNSQSLHLEIPARSGVVVGL